MLVRSLHAPELACISPQATQPPISTSRPPHTLIYACMHGWRQRCVRVLHCTASAAADAPMRGTTGLKAASVGGPSGRPERRARAGARGRSPPPLPAWAAARSARGLAPSMCGAGQLKREREREDHRAVCVCVCIGERARQAEKWKGATRPRADLVF